MLPNHCIKRTHPRPDSERLPAHPLPTTSRARRAAVPSPHTSARNSPTANSAVGRQRNTVIRDIATLSFLSGTCVDETGLCYSRRRPRPSRTDRPCEYFIYIFLEVMGFRHNRHQGPLDLLDTQTSIRVPGSARALATVSHFVADAKAIIWKHRKKHIRVHFVSGFIKRYGDVFWAKRPTCKPSTPTLSVVGTELATKCQRAIRPAAAMLVTAPRTKHSMLLFPVKKLQFPGMIIPTTVTAEVEIGTSSRRGPRKDICTV